MYKAEFTPTQQVIVQPIMLGGSCRFLKCTSPETWCCYHLHSAAIDCQWDKVRQALSEIRNNRFTLSHNEEEVVIAPLEMAHLIPVDGPFIVSNEGPPKSYYLQTMVWFVFYLYVVRSV